VLLAAGPDRVLVDERGGVVDKGHVITLGHLVNRVPPVTGPAQHVVVFPFDDSVQVYLGHVADEALVVARLKTMGSRGEHFLGRHTATKDTETATGLAVVDERELDIRFLDEFAGDCGPGTPVRADDNDVSHTSAKTMPSNKVFSGMSGPDTTGGGTCDRGCRLNRRHRRARADATARTRVRHGPTSQR